MEVTTTTGSQYGGSNRWGGGKSVDTRSVASRRSEPGALAICARNLTRSYKKGRKKVDVLKGLSLHLEKGTIYGLLGPSGCGKTTLLRCIVGRLTIDGGSLDVLGDEPNALGHQVPGSLIGYMPQEIALYDKFTVMETLYFCARLHAMPKHKTEPRATFLLNLLDIKFLKDRRIENLSGGQQRRVSFTAALLHEPELLVLDEPTVGVDPILRARLWKHLVDLTRGPNPTTILITTHYIEEARQANTVGMMRDGHLLAEDHPDVLMKSFKMNTLEAVFLHLCTAQQHYQSAYSSSHDGKHVALTDNFTATHNLSENSPLLSDSRNGATHTAPNNNSSHGHGNGTMANGNDSIGNEFNNRASINMHDDDGTSDHGSYDDRQAAKKKKLRSGPGMPTWRNFSALLVKNIRQLTRHVGHLVFQFILPALQVALFCLAIGRNPVDLHMAVYNQDTGVGDFSVADIYLHQLSNSTIIQRPVSSMDEAIHLVHEGKCWGVYEFSQNFTHDIIERLTHHNNTPSVVAGSQVGISLDSTNQQITISILLASFSAYENMVDLIPGVDVANESPIRINPPIYGESNPKFTDFIAPGIMVSITFAQAIGLTAIAFVLDKKQGLLDRVWAAGGRASDVILAHVVTQTLIVAGQCLFVLIVALAIFDLPLVGSLLAVIILIMLIGLSGMAYGLLISTLVDTEVAAIQFAMGSFFPVLLMSGILWPLEGTPIWVRYISYVLPTTWAAEAMRSLMLRGWTLYEFDVWMGFVIVLAYTTVLIVAAMLGIKSVN